MEKKTVIVENMRAVGMHHHGPLQLIVEGRYKLTWEPHNIHDLGNAMAVIDHKSKTRAYLTRNDAKLISTFCYANVLLGHIFCKPIVNAHVELQALGPQQECRLKFSVDSSNMAFVQHVLDEQGCTYKII
jgi:hypothetical protein